MNVLLVNCILYSSSSRKIVRRESVADSLICHVARGFMRLGHTVTVLAAEDYRPLREEDLGFPIVYLKSVMKGVLPPSLPWLPGLRRWLKTHGKAYDIIVSSELFSLATLTARLVCPERLLVWHELALKPRALFKIPAHVWYGAVVPLLMDNSLVVPRSEAARRFLLDQNVHGVVETPVDHGVDGQVFFPVDECGNHFVVVARLVVVKRVDRIITAFSHLLQRPGREDCHLMVIGDGPELCNLESLVQSLGVGHAVTFTGQIDHSQLALQLNRAIALLVNTARDNNLVSIAEAVASGTPVLTNSVPNNAAAIQNMGMGMVCDAWDADELEAMIDNRQMFHEACVAHRHLVTSEGCAQALVDAFLSHKPK